MGESMYEVWWSRGEGMRKGPRFRVLNDALRYVNPRVEWASFAIRNPDGTWHEGPKGHFFTHAAH